MATWAEAVIKLLHDAISSSEFHIASNEVDRWSWVLNG